MLETNSIIIMGNEVDLYTLFNVMSYFVLLPVVMIINLMKRKELDNDTNAVWVLLKVTGLVSAFYFPANIMNQKFGEWFSYGNGNYFGNLYTVPLVLFLATLIFLSEPLKRIDYYAPAFPVPLLLFKLACFSEGCCFGKEWENGMYSYARHRNEIPVQLIEEALALLLIVFLLLYLNSGRAKRGTVAPLYIFGYSFTRFLSEFLRGDFFPRYGILDVYHVQCIVGMVIGIISFLLMRKYGQKIDDYFFELFKPWRTVILSKIGILKRRRKSTTEEKIQEG